LKILIQSIYYPPELIGIAKYTGEMAEWLATRGHEVTVITTPPYYPEWKIWENYSSFSYSRETLNGVKVVRCPLWVPAKQSGLKRILHLLSFVISAAPIVFWKIRTEKPDVILVVYPYLFAGPWVQLATILSNSKTWLHIQDYEMDAAFELGFFKINWIQRIATRFENRLLQSFDLVSTISERMRDRLKPKGLSIEKTHLFPNWIDTQIIYPMTRNETFRAKFGLSSDEFVALYAGNMGVKQGLDLVIEVAKRLTDHKRIVFVLCGDGAVKKTLVNEAKGLDNVKFIPLQPYEQLNNLLNMADVHLLPQRADAADLVMPSKLTGMLASGRPVLATATPGTQVAEFVENAGLVIPPGDVQTFVEALLIMAANEKKCLTWGKQARERAMEWEKERVLLKFEQELMNCSHHQA